MSDISAYADLKIDSVSLIYSLSYKCSMPYKPAAMTFASFRKISVLLIRKSSMLKFRANYDQCTLGCQNLRYTCNKGEVSGNGTVCTWKR